MHFRHTMGFVFYGLCIVLMLSIRPYLSKKYLPHTGKMAIYYALYFFPILALLHAVAGGLICKWTLYYLLNII